MSVREILEQIPLGNEALSAQKERYRQVIVPEEWDRSLMASLEITPEKVLKNLTSANNSHHDGNHSNRINSRIAIAGFYVPEVIQQPEANLRQILRSAFNGGWLHDHLLNSGKGKKTQHGELQGAAVYILLSDLANQKPDLGLTAVDPYFAAACCYWHSFSSARGSEAAEYLLPPLPQIIQQAEVIIKQTEGLSLIEARPSIAWAQERALRGDYPQYPTLNRTEKTLLKYAVDRMRVADEMDALIGMESIVRTAVFDENRPFIVDFPEMNLDAEIQHRIKLSQADKSPDDVSRIFDEMVGRTIRELGSLAYESGVMKFFITDRLIKLLQMAEALVNNQTGAIIEAVYTRFAADLKAEAQEEGLSNILPTALESLNRERDGVKQILSGPKKLVTAEQYRRLSSLVEEACWMAEQKMPTPPIDISQKILAQKLIRVPGKYLTWQI